MTPLINIVPQVGIIFNDIAKLKRSIKKLTEVFLHIIAALALYSIRANAVNNHN
jgi:hypothetical protein